MNYSAVWVTQYWVDAANHQNIERLLELSDPNIEIAGPRGATHGHEVLRQWMARAGLTLTTSRVFARDRVVVHEQRGVWRSPATGEIMSEQAVASVFHTAEGRVVRYARYDTLEEALATSDLDAGDEVVRS
jgi:hypothetical protein